MIEIETKLTLDKDTINSPNLAPKFTADELKAIGRLVKEGYDLDEASREKWKKRLEAAFNLAMQLQEAKTFPWQGCSNVKFPLVTIAAIQWHSRAYPVLIQGPDVVKCTVNGPDPQGELRKRADRVSAYMSYQLLEESPSWEEEADRALLQVPIVGCAFKKTYYSGIEGRNVSDLVPAKNFCINYWAKSVETAQRKTHVVPMYRNDIYERVIANTFLDCREEQWFTGNPIPRPTMGQQKADARTGQNEPSKPDLTTPFEMLEQHVRLDLDGDGYAEPYIITVEANSAYVCRIVCNFDEEMIEYRDDVILRIKEDQYFTKIPFIPSPDGGIYDIGFGTFLGPLNQAVDSIINQLVDAGTLSTTAGGFLGRGVKIRGGEMSFRPFGWQRVDSTGEDLSKGIFPLPVREPSNVMFQLLGLLIDYTNRISGSTDIMVGENPGQNTPAQTSQLMAEQGAKINTAIFKRVWRALKSEYQKLYILNRRHTPVTVLHYGEESGWIRRDDFMGPIEAIRPAADPHLTSESQRVQQASMLKQAAATTPGYNRDAVERNWLRAMRVEDRDAIYPGIDKAPPLPNPKVELEKMKLEVKKQDIESKTKVKLLDILSKQEKTQAEIELLKAETAAMIASVGEAEAAHELKQFEAKIGVLERLDNSYREYIKLAMEGMQNASESGAGGGVA